METVARAAADRKQEMEGLAVAFERTVGEIVHRVSDIAQEMESSAGAMTRTAESTQSLSATLAAASAQSSANVQSVADATEELTGSIGEIDRQLRQSRDIASEAVTQAKAADLKVSELSKSGARIGDVVNLITAIAEQTNQLALNATIEAARAGEAGKGFAVVAQEVKQLASQTAKATNEITTQISGMQTATQQSVGAIKEIGATIASISEIDGTIAMAVDAQGTTAREISRSVEQAMRGSTQVASNIAAVSDGAKETRTASSQVFTSAQALASQSGHLKREVEKFLATVRAA